MHKLLVTLMLVSIPLVAVLWYIDQKKVDTPMRVFGKELITFNEKTPLRVMVVENKEDLARGLSGMPSLEPTEGMLFIFDQPDYHGIWMKDMRFPIDIMWLDSNRKIIYRKENVHPDTYPESFEPPNKARFVIETNAHYMSTFDIQVGDTADIPNFILPVDLQK